MAKGKKKVGNGETGRYIVQVHAGGDVTAIDKKTEKLYEGCKVITFKRPKKVTTVRCPGADAKARWRAAANKRKQCRGKKKRFVKCK